MRWNVEGADGKTGKELIVAVEANNAADAEAKARRKGVLVSAVHPSSIKTPGEKLDDMVGAALKSQTAVADRPTPPAAPAPIQYASQQQTPAHKKVPQYVGLAVGGIILRSFAVLGYVIGVLLLLGAVFAALNGGRELGSVTGLMVLGPALTSFVSAAFAHCIGEAAFALRNIARNSFR